MDTPLQTLDGIIINQPKCLLPLAEEAKRIAKEIRIEKINKQWTGIPREQLLNQYFNDQLNLIKILEQLAPLQLAKEHLPADIIDILERLDKADNIPFNQLYYVAENCADHYYSKVIETFVALLKCQLMDWCTSQKYTYPQNYTPSIFSRTKISQKHTGVCFRVRQYVRYALDYIINTSIKSVKWPNHIQNNVHIFHLM